jgi:Zn ribbon nucleic-acid-binding protein
MLESPHDPPTQPLTFGPCPMCEQPLRLSLIEPISPSHDQRMYECVSCGHSESRTVKYR